MLITKREKFTLLYIVPLILLLAILLFIFIKTKPGILPARNIGCIICHPTKFAKFSHPPYAKMQCLECHTPHKGKGLSRGRSELKEAVPGLCNTCHNTSKQFTKTVVHKPFADGKCLTCHNPHGSNNPFILVDDTASTCRSCHNQVKYASKKMQHKPFEKGWCVVCHTGHASDVEARLHEPQKELCLGCHQKIALEVNKPYQMEPFARGECTKCHNPHSSENDKVLQVSMPKLCANCHKPEWDQFNNAVSRHPVPDGTLGCLSCHMPHGSWYAKLLQGSFEAGSAGSCGACHVPHGSQGLFLSSTGNRTGADFEIAMCTKCHEMSVYYSADSHPVRDRYDPVAQKNLSCTSTCHQGLYWPDMSIFQNEVCLACHTGHNSPEAAIGSPIARKTKLLGISIENIKQKDWKDAPGKDEPIKPKEVSIDVPKGDSKVGKATLTAEGDEVLGKYHRLPDSQQFKLRTDQGCALCHEIVELP